MPPAPWLTLSLAAGPSLPDAGRGLNGGPGASGGGRNVLNCHRKATYQEQIP